MHSGTGSFAVDNGASAIAITSGTNYIFSAAVEANPMPKIVKIGVERHEPTVTAD